MRELNQINGTRSALQKPGCRPVWLAIFVSVLLVLVALPAKAADPVLQDIFANREVTLDPSGNINGSNVGAGVEAGEPRHGGQKGGRSVWISWVAPANGIAAFWTAGSGFDTLLSAYSFDNPGDTTFDKLREVALNDDAPGAEPTSLIQFGAIAGKRYEMAIDGFNGASGSIRLRWDFINATSPPPVIVSVPNDQAAKQGDTVTLTVKLQTSPDLHLQWRFNEDSNEQADLPNGQSTNYVITSLQATNVGRYALRVTIGNGGPNNRVRFWTTPVEIQINSDGQTNALARDKLLDALDTPLVGTDGTAGIRPVLSSVRRLKDGVVRGYNGSQIFNTTFATADPTEPAKCSGAPGASYWFAYQAPTNGTVVLDTVGSSFPTALAAYTYVPPLTNYANLIPIRCETATVGLGGAARVEFATLKGRSYAVVVDGVNGAKGIARLNYQLDVLRPPVAPTLLSQPTLRRVSAGSEVLLDPPVVGSQPLHYSWRKNTVGLTGATNSQLPLHAVAPVDSGDYVVTVSNHVGDPVTVTLPLKVLVPALLEWIPSVPGGVVSFSTITGQFYIVEKADSLPGTWQEWPARFPGDGARITLTNAPDQTGRFYRVRVE